MSIEMLGRDINGAVDYSLRFPADGESATFALSAGVETTVTIPAGTYNRAFFSFAVGTNVWVETGSDPITVPTGTVAFGKKELNPGVRQVAPGQVLRFICDTTSYVQVAFRQGESSGRI